MGPGTVGFDSKLYKGEIPIAEVEGWPLFGKRGDKYVSWCFDMRELSAWGRQKLELGISRVPGNREKEDWVILKFVKHKSPPYKAKRVRLKQVRKRSVTYNNWLQICVVSNEIITHWEKD